MVSPALPAHERASSITRPSLTTALRSLTPLALLALCTCGESVKETYRISIVAPGDAFTGAARVELLVADTVVDTEMVTGSMPFSLEWTDVDPLAIPMASFAVRALDADGKLVAFGQTPTLELLNRSEDIRILVQRPGTLVTRPPLDRTLRDPLSIAAIAQPVTRDVGLPITTPLFGAGFQAAANVEMPPSSSADLYLYNPILHETQLIRDALPRPRVGAAAMGLSDGTVMVFGGSSAPAPGGALEITAKLDKLALLRTGLGSFAVQQLASPREPAIELARSRMALALSGRPVYAFGGLNADGNPLASVIRIDPSNATDPVVPLVDAPPVVRTMSAPRVGHTATPFTRLDGNTPRATVLVYGGAPPGGPVADLFDQTTDGFMPITGGGTGRSDHAALALTDPVRVIVIGGLGEDGMPRGDSVVYDATMKSFSPGAITLRTPRHGFACFIVGNDLVVAGGFGADGKAIANAEIYAIKNNLGFVAEIPAAARGRASVTVLPNLSVVIAGGQTGAGDMAAASNAIEVYQPLPPP
jgi:hypothetical protein